ncbi:MaoC/PaaZ C-terminal domain-containing protein [Sphingomonas sanxanigenens]|uniref:MaoC family dehydratase n=1 Tax=Sphingomonas sanxanigenens DSM 19645 = NX02 TaxID=1123269 RepID=W0ADD3_9SPHN|nr:MaoC/PaaZ C-terminal domain-containing protein [Sphingomonas sanxanigenens]AHE55086.1 MaoC family dehydratase [Sphingomonas sanxanigenens DSM 19645 = NX02]
MKDVTVGQALPELAVPITASAIVAGAIATNDFENVHHDKAAAQATGVPDIFMNILTTNGLVQRYVSDWCGTAARIAAVEIRLGAPNFVGDTMRLSGHVARVENGRIDVAVSGRNAIGEHVTATVTLDRGETA